MTATTKKTAETFWEKSTLSRSLTKPSCVGLRKSSIATATVFTLINSCSYTIWPGTLSGNGAAVLGAGGLVGPLLGPNGLQLQRRRNRPMRHLRLRRHAKMRRRRRAAGQLGGVHHRRGEGLLRREPRGRVQRGAGRVGVGREWGLPVRRVRGRPQRELPEGAAGGGGRRGVGVQECLRSLWHGWMKDVNMSISY
ncbi:hypothetical protein SASPL_135387 [Salvia splendens]|uniref:Uncharacterized protein n=1 Tax=Salvia splendens TaxID=180675 RepID=A0A8X8WWF2_SALSN|nr:hypothetical protein SASPL_135387 [Salvia splendens]